MSLTHHFLKKLLLISVAAGLSTYLFCTKDPVSPGGDPKVTTKTPTLSIISPATDTILDSSTDSITIVGTYTDSSDVVDSLVINGTKIPLSLLSDTFSVTIYMATDTVSIVATLYYSKDKQITDNVEIVMETTVPQTQTPGMAKVTGTLLKESDAASAKRLSKSMTAYNAQGVQATVESVLPVSGADIMIYDASSLSSASDTTVQTDSMGKWEVELDEGSYFVFAVYFDRDNLEIITTSLPDIKAVEDQVTETDSAIAANDDVKPMLMSFLDDASANESNMFLASDIPEGLPIVLAFSEPMTRISAGDSVQGIILGEVDADSSELPIIDTVPIQKLWGPAGKELRIFPRNTLKVGATYKVIIPSSVKDLAMNKLDASYIGIFSVTSADQLPAFAVNNSFPLSGDTIPGGYPIEILFSRPLDGLSLNKNFIISSTQDPLVSGYFEVKSNVARFINKAAFVAAAKYDMTIKGATKDLLGDSIGTDFKISFHIQPKDSFEQVLGTAGTVATVVKQFIGAYIAGDIESFSQNFHSSFEMIETDPSGNTTRQQLANFLASMREEIEQRNILVKYGIIAPVFYYPTYNGQRLVAWKLTNGTTSVYFEDLGPTGSFGKIPRVFDLDYNNITDSVSFVNRAIVYNGDTLYFAPDMSKAFLSDGTREDDPTIFGRLLRSETNVETQDILMDIRSSFVLRDLVATDGNDTAKVMIELTDEMQFKDGKRPFPVLDTVNPPPDVEKHVMALQTKLVFSSSKWLVLQIAAKELYSGNKEEFNPTQITDDSFQFQEFTQTQPIEFVSPRQKSTGVQVPIVLEWAAADPSVIKGYIVAIANELSGGNEGRLMFTNKTKIVINGDGTVDSNTTILNVDPATLHVPLPHFSARLTTFTVSDSDIYVWKVVGVGESTFSSATTNGLRVLADSDFGSHRGIGIFTLMDIMPDISTDMGMFNPNQMEDRFADRDGDYYPDWIEKGFGTSPDDPSSYPNFTLDSDLDGFPDFMEIFAGTDPQDKASIPVDVDPKDGIADALQIRPDWRPELAMDDDGDGFPNEIEMVFGTDPWNPDSRPTKSIKPSVPVNTYYGALDLGGQGWSRINFSLISDTTGDFVSVDTTELQGIAKNGQNLTLKLHWSVGEWVFYLPVVNGINSGKFIKVRFRMQDNMLGGPVDMADFEGGGGPFIGHFIASTDSAVDFNSMSGGTSLPPSTHTGEINLGPPPMDRLIRPDSGSTDMGLKIGVDEFNIPLITLYINGDTLSGNGFWGPGQWPAIGFDYNDGTKEYHLDGNLHRTGDPASGNDTLVLAGFLGIRNADGYKNENDFIVFLGNYQSIEKPSGVWTGWYTALMGPVNMGPLPFIGTQDSVDAALALTRSTGLIMETRKIVTITSTSKDPMGPWSATVDSSTYFIMEKTGDYKSVWIVDFEGQLCIALSSQGPGGPGGPGPGLPFYQGDSLSIIAALVASGNQVKVAAPDPFVVTVDPTSLKMQFDPADPSRFRWIIFDATNPSVLLVFTGIDSDPSQLMIDEFPLVMEEMGSVEPMNTPFGGDSLSIVNALAASANIVIVDGRTPMELTVDPSTLALFSDPMHPEGRGWIVKESATSVDSYFFLGLEMDPFTLKLINGKPAVSFLDLKVPVDPTEPAIMPFNGDSLILVNALAASVNRVLMGGPTPVELLVDPSTLAMFSDPMNPGKWGWGIKRSATSAEIYIFLGLETDPFKLKMNGDLPIVMSLNSGTGEPTDSLPPVEPVGMIIPFNGDSLSIVNALVASANIVVVDGPTVVEITVDPLTLALFSNPTNPNEKGWTVQDSAIPTDIYVFMGLETDPLKLKMIGNKPAVFKF